MHLSNAFSRAPPTNSLAKRSHYANRLSTTTSTTRINMMIDDPSSHILSTMDFLQSLPTNILADLDTVGSLPTSVDTIQSALSDVVPGASTYSKTSYYTTLGLYVLSFPGIWSQVKRSTKAKTKRKTYVSDGENVEKGKDLRQQAGEIMAYMKANNYEVVEAGEVITFRGLVKKSLSQALFLTFCVIFGMGSLALVLQIGLQDFSLPIIGVPNWFLLCFLGPYAGIYYWRSGDRVDDIKVKLSSNDEETENSIVVEGNDDEIERMWQTLELREKGMIKVDGLFESSA